jgi:lactoylglutathione lyase
MPPARLAATIVYVPDVRAGLEFYERAFGLIRSHLDDDGGYGEIDVGGLRLGFDSEALADRWGPVGGFRPNRADDVPPAIELMFEVEDVGEAVARAETAGATALSLPESKPWGQTIAYLRDPWGILIAVGTPWRATSRQVER